jgi:hypothetical protein
MKKKFGKAIAIAAIGAGAILGARVGLVVAMAFSPQEVLTVLVVGFVACAFVFGSRG